MVSSGDVSAPRKGAQRSRSDAATAHDTSLLRESLAQLCAKAVRQLQHHLQLSSHHFPLVQCVQAQGGSGRSHHVKASAVALVTGQAGYKAVLTWMRQRLQTCWFHSETLGRQRHLLRQAHRADLSSLHPFDMLLGLPIPIRPRVPSGQPQWLCTGRGW